MSRDLFFGPTDQREVIIEFLFTRMVTDIHGSLSYHEFANYRIFLHTEFHGASRIYISCHEFANSIIRDKEKFDNSQIRDIKKIRDSP